MDRCCLIQSAKPRPEEAKAKEDFVVPTAAAAFTLLVKVVKETGYKCGFYSFRKRHLWLVCDDDRLQRCWAARPVTKP